VANIRQADAPVDETAEQLRAIMQTGEHPSGEKLYKELAKRKLIQPR
jgi:hypothetical protein